MSPRGPGGPSIVPDRAPNASVPQYSNSTTSSGPDPYAGLDPRLAGVYKQFGITPGAPGSGLADASYWNNKITTGDAGYYLGRLTSDFQGSGPDARGGGGGGSFSAVAPPQVSLPNIYGGVSVGGPTDFRVPTQGAPVTYTPFSYGSFAAPTGQDVLNEPGYAFGLDQGEKALQTNEALRGTLRSGGAAKELDRYATDYATTKYDDAYQRALNTFQTNYGTAFQTSQANNAGALNAFGANTQATLGFGGLAAQRAAMLNNYTLGAGQLALGSKTADQNYALGRGNLDLGYYNAANNYNLGMAGIGLGYGQLGLGYYNAGNQNALNWGYYGLAGQQQDFNQGYSLTQLGLGAAENTNAAAGQYGANASNLITGQGNAAASGIVGSSNAWNQGLGGVANAAMGGYGMYYGYGGWPGMGRRTTTQPPPSSAGGYGGIAGYGTNPYD